MGHRRADGTALKQQWSNVLSLPGIQVMTHAKAEYDTGLNAGDTTFHCPRIQTCQHTNTTHRLTFVYDAGPSLNQHRV